MKENEIEKTLIALSSLPRLKLLAVIAKDRAVTVSLLASLCGLTDQTCSYHLKELENANLIHVHKSGKFRFFSLNLDVLKYVAEFLLFNKFTATFAEKGPENETK